MGEPAALPIVLLMGLLWGEKVQAAAPGLPLCAAAVAAAVADRLPCIALAPLHRVVLTGLGILSRVLNTLADLQHGE